MQPRIKCYDCGHEMETEVSADGKSIRVKQCECQKPSQDDQDFYDMGYDQGYNDHKNGIRY